MVLIAIVRAVYRESSGVTAGARRRRYGVVALAATLGFVWPGDVLAQSATPAQQCLEAHEQAQVKRMARDLVTTLDLLKSCSEAHCPSFVQADCVRWLEEVTSEIPTVSFVARSEDGDETDVTVYVGDHVIAKRLDGRPVELNPGAYEFRFERPPAAPVLKRVVLREGEKNRVVAAEFDLHPDAPVTPAPAPAAPVTEDAGPSEYRPIPKLTFVLGGVAVLGGAAAVTFGTLARSSRQDAADSCAPLCSDSEVAPIRGKGIAADTSLGVAVVAAGAATYFFVTRPTRTRSVGRAPHVVVGAVRRGGFIGMEGNF